MEIIVKVKSSSSDSIYHVSLSNENGLLRFNCNCNSGMVKGMCHHLTDILDGDISALDNESDIHAVKEFLYSLDKQKIVFFFEEYKKQTLVIDDEIKLIDKEIKKLKKKKAEIKSVFGKRFSDGF